MNAMDEKLQHLIARHDELERLLQDPSVAQQSGRLKTLAKEYNETGRAIALHDELLAIARSIADARRAQGDGSDAELAQLAREEFATLERRQQDLTKELHTLLRPKDSLERKNVLLEIRAGVGGEEAALFAADLFRMYMRFAETQGCRVELVSTSRTDIGGLKEAIFEIKGAEAYARFRYESGVHRVQRVPETEKSGRVHTSTATVVVLPEPEAVDIVLKPEDVKVDATTASGHGGQSVNTTYSAIRLTHLPSGITVSCQDERSQKQNKERAFQILRARLFAHELEKQQRADSAARKSQVGTGDRSEKIRTYNVPQDRVTDHRIQQSFPAIVHILDGNLQPIVDALRASEEAAS